MGRTSTERRLHDHGPPTAAAAAAAATVALLSPPGSFRERATPVELENVALEEVELVDVRVDDESDSLMTPTP